MRIINADRRVGLKIDTVHLYKDYMICRSINGFRKECWQQVCIYIIATICRES